MNRQLGKAPIGLHIIAAKQKVEQEDADKIALPLLISLDAAKRGQAPAMLADTLTRHLMMAIVIWSRSNNKHLYNNSVKAWEALVKACRRPTQLLDLTTGEYAAIRLAVAQYVRAMPKLEVGMLVYASEAAEATLKAHDAKAKAAA